PPRCCARSGRRARWPSCGFRSRTNCPDPEMKRLLCSLMLFALTGFGAAASATDRIALISTRMVLERKFTLMEAAARAHGVELAWTQVDAEGEAGVDRVLEGARFVLIDAPRVDDQALVERVAGERLRKAELPGVSINVMSPPVRLRAIGVDAARAQRVFEYYVGGMRANH